MHFYLEGLTDQQREAVLHEGSPLLVLAGAGSGKTRVVTRRIARLIAEGLARPQEVLALTFTNKAAGEMRERALRLLACEDGESGGRTDARGSDRGDADPVPARLPWISTFHSACARILRNDGKALGLESDFTIYDAADSLAAITTTASDLGINREIYAPRLLLSVIRRAKGQGLGPDQFEGLDFGVDAKVQQVYPAYQARLRESGAVDFDDLLFMTTRLFEEHTDILNAYRERFRRILVDEYQDTNGAQHHILKLLAGQGGNLCVVGDEDQSIYKWRGAEVEGILQMERAYPGTHVIRLEKNFRSSAAILRGAAGVIERNRRRRDKALIPTRETGEKLVLYSAPDDGAEAEYVASKVIDIRKGSGDPSRPSSTAVFFRTHAQARPLEEAFRRHRIPHRVVAGFRFFDRKEIKDVVSYFKVLVNPRAEDALLRIINVPPRGIGGTTIQQLKETARKTGRTIWDVIARPGEAVHGSAKNRVADFHQLMARLTEEAVHLPVADLFHSLLVRTGYAEFCRQTGREAVLKEFADSLKEFEGEWKSDAALRLRDYLDETALLSDIDIVEGEPGGDVLLMTLHAAKGLEFDTVFLTGVEEGLIPHSQSLRAAEGDIEEERRLFYVGMTRAQNRLILTRSLTRTQHGQTRSHPESLFLSEIPEDVLIREGKESRFGQKAAFSGMGGDGRRRKPRRGEGSTGPPGGHFSGQAESEVRTSAPGQWKMGVRVLHDTFGSGTIVGSRGSGDDLCVTVRFSTGTKQLMIKYAPIRIAS